MGLIFVWPFNNRCVYFCSGHIRLADLGLAKVLKSTVDRTSRCDFVSLLWD